MRTSRRSVDDGRLADARRAPAAGLRADGDEAPWNGGVKFFHWLIALLLLAQVTLGLLATGWRVSPTKLDLFVWHKSTGLLILLLMLLRLAWRLASRTPALPAGMPAWERAAARATHVLLYGLMLALPITGWVIQSASGMPFRVFWTLPLPPIVATDKALAELAAQLHFWLVIALVLLLVAHVGAALRHHYVRHDPVLRRMLPARRSRA